MVTPTSDSVGALVDAQAWPKIALLTNAEELAASVGSRQDYKALYRELGEFISQYQNLANTLKANINELSTNVIALETALRAKSMALDSANQQYSVLQNTFARSFQDLASTSTHYDIKGPDFDKFKNFKGEEDKADLAEFLYNINAKFLHNAHQFKTEQAKMAWYSTRIEGNARKQIQHGLKDNGHVDFADCNAITAILKLAYVRVDAARVATAKLRAEKQGKRAFSDFIALFQSIYPTCERDDATIIEILSINMNPELYTRLVNLNRDDGLPKTIIEYISLCRVEDSKLRQINDQARDQNKGYFSSSGGNSSSSPPAGDPMDISKMDLTTITNGKLTEMEKLRRVTNNLCMYCGEDHPTVSCQKLKAKEARTLKDIIAGASKETLAAALSAKN